MIKVRIVFLGILGFGEMEKGTYGQSDLAMGFGVGTLFGRFFKLSIGLGRFFSLAKKALQKNALEQ